MAILEPTQLNPQFLTVSFLSWRIMFGKPLVLWIEMSVFATAPFTVDLFREEIKERRLQFKLRETLRLTGHIVSHGGAHVFRCDFLI